MERVSLPRLAWWLHRLHLRHGASAVVAMAGVVLLAALLALTAAAQLRLQRGQAELDRRVASLRTQASAPVRRGKVVSLPLPPMTQRFLITRRILTTLGKAGLAPERMRFRFEAVEDAGLTRQVAVFTLKGRWSQVASALARLQAADRSLYIARLRVTREQTTDDEVAAEVQLAVAMVDRAAEALER